jgi:hypothetical protein
VRTLVTTPSLLVHHPMGNPAAKLYTYSVRDPLRLADADQADQAGRRVTQVREPGM